MSFLDLVETVDPFTGFGALTGRGASGGAITRSLGWDPLGSTPTVSGQAPYAGSYDPSGNYVPIQPVGSAQDMAAQILASEFSSWEQTFKPIESKMLNQSSLNNPNILPDAVNKATADTGTAYDAMSGAQQRKLAAQGVNASPAQQQASRRILSLSKAAAVAGAQNQARQGVATQDELIALGTAPNPQMVPGV